ncbi:MAG: nucleotidyl transferase AbiEii/AbiGii toxin family protein [Phycisphaerae bacterium]|nr:nucleotidyl transferase AbiEii/AbiGii toxin family protein [Saprospiraceae bacterium]
MLQHHTVEPGTLGLLKKIMAVPELSGFNLAGGTALALQIGHRKSVDLDFFGARPIDKDEMVALLEVLGDLHVLQHSRNILIFNLDGIKVDFVNYKYLWLREITINEGIRLVSLPDIGAMKLGAIAGRGKKRDFTDLYFLLKKFTLTKLLAFYREKYPDGNEFLVLRSLTYFDDADEDKDLELFQKADWPEVKKSIANEVKKIMK